MYLRHFQLEVKPFQITADPRFLWLGEKHKEALATMRYGILDNRGFLLLTGEVGTGKTILINQLVRMLEIDTVVATLPDPDLESMDFYNLLADGFQMKRTFDSKGAFLIHLRDFLYQTHAEQKQVLLIIDESQRLNHRLMEDIRVLSNIELHDKKLINIFFVGQQEFNSILLTPQNRALAQRITVRYHIEPLSQDETGDYVAHRLKVSGATRKIFNSSAVSEVYDFSGGIPRLINIICDHALLTAYAKGMRQVDDKIIQECAEELRIPFKYSEDLSSTTAGPVGAQNPSVNAVAPGQAGQENAISEKTDSDQLPLSNVSQIEAPPSRAWSLVHVAMILALLVIFAFAVTHFSRKEKQRWDAEDLTPQKYKTTLEQEKELLVTKLRQGTKSESLPPAAGLSTTQEQSGDSPNQIPDPAIDRRTPATKEAPSSGPPSGEQETALADESLRATMPEKALLKKEIGEIEPLPLIKEDIVIHFEINSNEIEGDNYAILDNIAHYLIQHSEESINVRGYTDSSGSPGYNESVSRFRANAVKSYLVGKGVDAARIATFAMGDHAPVASNETLEGRRLNRRVEIEFLQVSAKEEAPEKPRL